MIKIPRSILREYDIRGIVGETLSADDAMAIGLAFANILAEGGGRTVCVGYDGRLSSPALSLALVGGLTAGGCDVVHIGRGPTPLLYYAGHVLKADGAVMITGSHNPPDHNGFKSSAPTSRFTARTSRTGRRRRAAGRRRTARGSVRAMDIARRL